MNKKTGALVAAMVAVGAAAIFLFMGGEPGQVTKPQADSTAPEGAAIVKVSVPPLEGQAAMGERAFNAKCAECHGENAAGRQGKGPPLVHKYYEPSHHGDMAFRLAPRQGVRAHHWKFGDMPPVEGLTEGDINAIIAYVRSLQQANGIF